MHSRVVSVLLLMGLASSASAAVEFEPKQPIEGDAVWVTYADTIDAHPQRGECRTEHHTTRQPGKNGATFTIRTVVHGSCGASSLPEAQLLGKLPAGDYVVRAGRAEGRVHVQPANTDPGPLSLTRRIQLAVAQQVRVPVLGCGRDLAPNAPAPPPVEMFATDQRLLRQLRLALPKLTESELGSLLWQLVNVQVTLTGGQFRYSVEGSCCDDLGIRISGSGSVGPGGVVTVGPAKQGSYDCRPPRPV